MQGNISKLKHKISNKVQRHCIDFTSISGSNKIIKVDDLSFDTANWGPLLLAILSNQFKVVHYYIEDLKLNPAIFLVKPKTSEE
jgi:hypothetical protein